MVLGEGGTNGGDDFHKGSVLVVGKLVLHVLLGRQEFHLCLAEGLIEILQRIVGCDCSFRKRHIADRLNRRAYNGFFFIHGVSH